jgi:hypothetical protein
LVVIPETAFDPMWILLSQWEDKMEFKQALEKAIDGQRVHAIFQAIHDAVAPLCKTTTDGNGGEETTLLDWLESGQYNDTDTPESIAEEWDGADTDEWEEYEPDSLYDLANNCGLELAPYDFRGTKVPAFNCHIDALMQTVFAMLNKQPDEPMANDMQIHLSGSRLIVDGQYVTVCFPKIKWEEQ